MQEMANNAADAGSRYEAISTKSSPGRTCRIEYCKASGRCCCARCDKGLLMEVIMRGIDLVESGGLRIFGKMTLMVMLGRDCRFDAPKEIKEKEKWQFEY